MNIPSHLFFITTFEVGCSAPNFITKTRHAGKSPGLEMANFLVCTELKLKQDCVWGGGSFQRPPAMVTFMCQLHWATVYPDIWLHMSECVCTHVFGWDPHLISRLKAKCPPQCGGPHPIYWRPEQNKRLSQKEFFPFACLRAGTRITCLWAQTGTTPSALTANLGLLNLHNHMNQFFFSLI